MLDVVLSQFTNFQHDPKDLASLSDYNVTAFLELSTMPGLLWIGTMRGGVNRFDVDTQTFSRVSRWQDCLGTSPITALLEDRTRPGTFWVGLRGVGLQDGGLVHIDPQKDACTQYLHDVNDPHSLSHNDVTALYQDRTGVLWVGTWTGLNKAVPLPRFRAYRHDPDNVHSLGHPQVFCIYEAPSEPGTLWIGTNGGGLNRLNRARGTYTHYFTAPNHPLHRVLAMFEDEQQRFWIGHANVLPCLPLAGLPGY